MTNVTISKNWTGRTVDGKFPLLTWLGGSEGCGVFLTKLQGERTGKAAIKLIPAEAAEGRAAAWEAALELAPHPHLLRVYEYGLCQTDGAELVYVVTEYAPEVLGEILPERALTAEETRTVLEPLLGALEYLHGRGLVHGHVKPSNILADGDDLKLTADHLLQADAAGRAPAQRNYATPEMAHGIVSPASDVWSLGVTLVEVLTQRRPAYGADGEPVVPEGVPEPFAGIAHECLRTDPAKRCSLQQIRVRLNPEAAGVKQNTTQTVTDASVAKVKEPATVPVASQKVHNERPAESSKSWIRIVALLALVTVMAIAWFLRPHPNGKSLANEHPELAVPQHMLAPAEKEPAKKLPVTPATAKSAVAERVKPDVLRSALETIHGTVRVDVKVTAGTDGNVADASFADYGPSHYFADAAMKAAKQWKFKPVRVNGQATKSVWLLKFGFTRDGDSVTATEVSP